MSIQTGRGKRRQREWESDGEGEIEEIKYDVPQTETEMETNESQIETQTETNEQQPTNKAKRLDAGPNDKHNHIYYKNNNRRNHNKHHRPQHNYNLAKLEAEITAYGSRTLNDHEAKDYSYKLQLYEELKKDPRTEPLSEYEMPDDYINQEGKIDRKRKLELLHAKAKGPNTKDKTHWESDQFRKAQSLIRNNVDEIVVPGQKDYEYVFDESQFVEFDNDKPLEGEKQSVTESITQINMDNERMSLPVYQFRDQFLKSVDENQVLIVVGETGSGKTTQLPQYLYESGYCQGNNGEVLKVGCTQPRRVAATSVAARVANEMNCKLGKEVGYSIRFEDETSSQTRIKYLTDGTLLREFLNDPELSTYGALMIDEAHERTISTEILLSLLKDVINERKDLKVIVASATINAKKFSDFFNGAPIFNIPGRRFPVDIHYTKNPEANYIQAAINTIFLIHTKKPLGDILVFLTGQEEIEAMQENLLEASNTLGSLVGELIVCPIYANLPSELQQRIFEPTPPNSRKVVLATNIAETSITIDGIKYVIDSGYVKENVYNPSTGMDSLVVTPCSKASADQRAGRAGRVGPGECFRLYTKWSFHNELLSNPLPEILRGNLISTVLLLLSLGITDLIGFEFMDPPSAETLIKCLETLYALGALNSKGELTTTGRTMTEFPVDPMFSKALIASGKLGVIDDVLSVIAMLSESSSLFYRPKDKRQQADEKKAHFHSPQGDHLTLLSVWKEWVDTEYSNLWCQDNFVQYRSLKRVREVRQQLQSLCTKTGILQHPPISEETTILNIQKSITAGFFPHVAKLSKLGDSYRSLKRNQPISIHPSSSLFKVKPPPKLLLYHELVLTSKEYMRNCMIVEEKWLQELAPHYYKEMK